MNVRYTYHARDRMVEMGVSELIVQAVLAQPEIDMCSPVSKGRRVEGHRRCVRGNLCVVYFYDGPAKVVVTVVPRTYEKYKRKDAS